MKAKWILGSLMLIALTTLTPKAEGTGNETGNGGNVVLCLKNGAISSVELLDYYEATTYWGFHLDLGELMLDPLQKVHNVLERARRFHPETADELEKRAQGFFDDAILVSGVELTPVDDAGQYFLPVGCSLKQIAVQRPKEFPQDKTFLINKDIWDRLDNDQKAGLILHEIAYEKLLHEPTPFGLKSDQYPRDSRIARYFNALISSSEYESLTFEQYRPMLSKVWFVRDLVYDGLLLEGVTWRANGMESALSWASQNEIKIRGTTYFIAKGSTLIWKDDQLIDIGNLDHAMEVPVGNREFLAKAGYEVRFFVQNSSVESLMLGKSESIEVGGSSVVLEEGTPVNFDPNGVPREFAPQDETAWPVKNGVVWNRPGKMRPSRVYLDSSGKIRQLICLSHHHDTNLIRNDGVMITCKADAPLCTQGTKGTSVDWPVNVGFDEEGKLSWYIDVLDSTKGTCE